MQRRSWLCQSITGAAIPACSITVYTAGTTTKATIYGDQAGSSALGNPITAGSDGTYAYYAPSGRYTEVLSAPGFTFGAAQTQDFILHDPFAAPAVTPNIFATTTWLNATGTCTNIPSPVVGRTFCFDQTQNALKFWSGSTWLQQQVGVTVSVLDYGAKGNTQTVTDGVMSSGGTTLTSATGSFTSGDVGKNVTVAVGAQLLSTTISAVTNSTTVTVASAVWANVSSARARWGTDDTAAINLALAALNTNVGGVLYFPKAIYWNNSQLSAIPNQVTIRGAGPTTSQLYCNHDADCVRTAAAVNGSNAVFNLYQDIGLLTDRPAHTGGGFADTAGTYLVFEHVQVSGPFKYSMILDQSEIARVYLSDFEIGATNTLCGIWIVSGAERTVGANPYFTNDIAIDGNQFNTSNTGATGICNDGGVNHYIANNNFNGGSNAMWMSGVRGLTLVNNASEGHANSPFTFSNVTGQGSITKRPNSGALIAGNTAADATAYHYVLNYADSFTITGNTSGGFTTAMINLNGGVPMGNTISGNSKIIADSGRTAAGFVAASSANLVVSNDYTQQMQTYVATGHAGGAQTVTPATMGLTSVSPALAESFAVGDVLFVENNDLTNQEFVTVTAVGGTTFTATFGSSKSANWLVYGTTRTQKSLGLAVGAPTGGGKGDGTINIATGGGYYINGVQIATMTLTNASGTIANAAHMVQDTVTLTGGTAGVALAGAAAFAGATSYTCVCDNDSAVLACRVVQNGGNGFTVTSGAGTDVVRFICVGS